ncbi:hypothetical protein GH714_024901 [Hevea brasiliensis]|uniref:Uncharacterized protein n=1 Tax=Hevea brasiliensis TaxID=3981 RepID=A0A6A6M429_HEVBR|nr:hypothetical protein GH714_024901 [Hevea brasiliensis]
MSSYVAPIESVALQAQSQGISTSNFQQSKHPYNVSAKHATAYVAETPIDREVLAMPDNSDRIGEIGAMLGNLQ